MKLSNESRLEELMKFKNDFNEKLRNAYSLYEQRSKSISNNNINNENNKETLMKKNKTRNLPKITSSGKGKAKFIFKSAFDEDGDIDYIKIRKVGKAPIKLMSNTWKPQFMVCDYFGKFKRLRDNYEMSNWEQVIKYFFNFLINRQESIYVKEHIIKRKNCPLDII